MYALTGYFASSLKGLRRKGKPANYELNEGDKTNIQRKANAKFARHINGYDELGNRNNSLPAPTCLSLCVPLIDQIGREITRPKLTAHSPLCVCVSEDCV